MIKVLPLLSSGSKFSFLEVGTLDYEIRIGFAEDNSLDQSLVRASHWSGLTKLTQYVCLL